MNINWKKYVDQIYCIRYIGEDQYRKTKCDEEFKRLGIFDSGIYFEFTNINSPFYKDIYYKFFDKFNKEHPYSYVTDCTFGHYYCLKHAQFHNYERVLLLESDCVFLKDENQIIELLESSKNVMDNDENSIFVLNSCYTECPPATFILPTEFKINLYKNDDIWCAGFNIYSKNAYDVFIRKYENYEFFTNDTYKFIYDNEINVYDNEVNIAIQQDWVKMTVNFDVLYNIDINNDYINRFKNTSKLELLGSFVMNFNNLQKANNYSLDLDSDNRYIKYYIKLFEQINKYLFDNKLKLENYLVSK